MSMLELESSLSGMNTALEAQKSAVDLMHKGLNLTDASSRPVRVESHQAQNTLEAKAVAGLGSKIDIEV